jgi:hypothetical protein
MVSGTGFYWGNKEHKLENLTNYLLLFTLICFVITLYEESWMLVKVTFGLFVFTGFAHLLARISHLIEKHYHNWNGIFFNRKKKKA